jgi:hypothetical protein
MRYHLLVLNIINALVFLWLLTIFNSIFDFQQVLVTSQNKLVIFDVFEAISHIFTYLLYFVSYGIGNISSSLITTTFSPIPLYDINFMYSFMDNFFQLFLSKWFIFPEGTAPTLAQAPTLIGGELGVFTEDLYLLSFQVLFILSILYAIRALFQNKPKFNFIVVGSLVLMIVIPLMIFGFRDMMNLFNIQIEYLENLKNPLDIRLTTLPVDDALKFFASPVALMAIVSYIYLEISFQANYADVVTKPSLERSGRLEAQLKILQRESQFIVADVDKIKEEAKTKIEELSLEERETVGGLFKGGERFSYIQEMITRKKLEEEEKKLITAASKTRRLGRYLDRLFREDPEAQDTLTAKTSAPRPKSLITSTITTFSFRVILLIIISFIIIHPRWFLINVFQMPPAMTESVVMYSPEVIIILMGPLVILFPLISWIIQYLKHRNLIIRLKQEGRIKEILASVGDYVILEDKKEKEKEDEPEIVAEEAT